MLKEIFSYIKKHKIAYFLVSICILLEYSIVLVPTQIIQYIVDEITNNTLSGNSLQLSLGILLVTIIIGYLAGYYWMYNLYVLSNKFLYELRLKMFDKFLKMRQSFYEKFRTGDMLTRFTNDGQDYQSIVGYGAMNFLFAVSYMLFVIPAMFNISFKITLMASLPIIIGGILIYYAGVKYDELVEKEREAVSNLSNEVLEIVEGIRVIRAYNNNSTAYNKFVEKTNELKRKNDKIAFYSSVFSKIPNIFSGISTSVVVYFGAYALFNNELTLGKLVALELYAVMLLDPMWILTEFIAVFKTSRVSYGRIKELLETGDDLQQDGKIELKEINKIEFRNYSFKYKKDLENSLNNFNLILNKGETLGVIGKTGSGKTSLIRQLIVQYPLGDGEILINDINLKEYKRESIEKLISYVPQEHFLFSRDVLSNIKVGKDDASDLEVSNAIKAAAFDGDIENLSDGLNTMVGEKGVSISGGQKQRILLARAFLKNSDLLILDDALSAVDAKTERKILKGIVELRKDKTNIIVTHRLSAINGADKIIVMDNGRVSEAGTSEELFKLKGWYYEQFIVQDLKKDGDE